MIFPSVFLPPSNLDLFFSRSLRADTARCPAAFALVEFCANYRILFSPFSFVLSTRPELLTTQSSRSPPFLAPVSSHDLLSCVDSPRDEVFLFANLFLCPSSTRFSSPGGKICYAILDLPLTFSFGFA